MPLDATTLPAPASSRALQRIGALAAHGWHAKHYAPTADAGGLRPEDLAAAAAPAFFGWRVVWAAFTVAVFGWGVGFYGPPVFLHAIHEARG